MTTIDQLIAKANSTLNVLDNLLNQRLTETILSDDETTPDPTLDDNNVWTVTQPTPDAQSNYIGSYKLALEGSCAYVQLVTVINHTVPSDGIAVRYQACGSSTWLNLATVAALQDKSVQAFEIRSASAFEVQIRLGQQWCYGWDFEVNNGGWTKLVPPDRGVYVTNEGWLAQDTQSLNQCLVVSPVATIAHALIQIEITLDTPTVSPSNGLQFGINGGTLQTVNLQTGVHVYVFTNITQVNNGQSLLLQFWTDDAAPVATPDGYLRRVQLIGQGALPGYTGGSLC